MKKFALALSFLLILIYSSAQETSTTRNSFLSAGLIQVKESANFGLVFKGAGINYGMSWNFINAKRRITYKYDLGLGVLFSRKIPALAFYLKPVDLAYNFKLPGLKNNLYIGPSLKLEYNYNLYPDLQAGFDYWFTNFSLGVNARTDFKYKTSSFTIMINSSLLGLVSRQPDYRNPYYYDIGFKHAIKHLHQDMTFGSFNRFNSTSLEILWKCKPDSRITLGYVLKYNGYFQSPDITFINHNIKLIIKKK